MNKISFETKLTVPFCDLDPLNIVWHGNYLKYLELARGEFFDYSFGRTNFCDETSFEVYEDQVKYLCVTNSMTPNNHHFDRIDLLHDADSRKLLKIRLSRNLPSGVSDIKCIEALKSILKGCEYWYNIKMPALDIADFSKLRNNSEPDTKEWRVEDNSFLIRLSILFEKSDVARIELHIESKKARIWLEENICSI